ncbi:MAG: RNA polymerase sigma factor [Ktedonobacteraceae bacterium]|nr:RNA polymerase sigma factor [Ktedonobacteraceae bacterium]
MDDDYARDLDDAEILAKITENLNDNFHLLVEKYKTPIFPMALGMLGNQQDALEVTAYTFEQAYLSLPGLIAGGRAINFRPWLSTIVTNACRNRWRRDKRQRLLAVISVDTKDGRSRVESMPRCHVLSAENEAIRHENIEELYRLLDRLRSPKREIVVLYYIEGLSDHEIASQLGKDREAIKKMRERAVKKMREMRDNEQ